MVLSLAAIDPATGEVWCSKAGAEPPLVLRTDGGIETLDEGGLPLGVEPQETYAGAALRLAPGDLLLMLTDGFTEARQGEEFLGAEGLIALVREVRRLPTLGAIGDSILEGARRFAGDALTDDACLLLARRTA